MKAKEGKLIVFEGGEKAGKSTQIALLAERLKKAGIDFVATKEPGGTEEGQKLRQELLYERLTPEEELALFLEDRRIHFKHKVLPALKEGKWVLCDRCSPSTEAYQIDSRGIDIRVFYEADIRARKKRNFDLIILLDMDPREAMARTERETIFEKEDWEFHDKVRESYRRQAEEDPQRWLVLSGAVSVEGLSEQIWQEIQKRFL